MWKHSMMSSTHISALPEEVLVLIFGQLHGNKKHANLINATLFYPQWNRIISQSHRLMDKLQLKLNSTSFQEDAALEAFKLTRLYRHVVWDHDCERDNVTSKIFNEISKLDYLNTLEVSHWRPSNAELMENFQKLSQCKSIRCLILKGCHTSDIDNQDIADDQEIARIEFKSLRKLQLYESNPYILNFIICKELGIFAYVEPWYSRGFNRWIVAFFNQLDRCDEISVKFLSWNFVDVFTPKFRWNKLKLICEIDEDSYPDAAAIAGMKALLEASTAENATADIELSGSNSDAYIQLWLTILNSCTAIESLSLVDFKELPFELTRLRNLSEVRKLRINAKILQDVNNFSHLSSKLRNVTNLTILCEQYFDMYLSDDDALTYQPFFNQITELALSSGFVDSNSGPNPNMRDHSHLISIILCENLNAICIIESFFSDLRGNTNFELGDQLNELFLRFCQRNQNLRRIEIIKVISTQRFNSGNESLIGWYDQLRATTIETCNVMITHDEEESVTPMNWRDAEVDEIELFGRRLTEAENRFFI